MLCAGQDSLFFEDAEKVKKKLTCVEYTRYGVYVNPEIPFAYTFYKAEGRRLHVKQYWEIMRDLREDRDLKQSEVAEALGITQQVYSRYELGINELPIHHLVALCKFYKVSSDYILGLSAAEK